MTETGVASIPIETPAGTFEDFFRTVEPRLRRALIAAVGAEAGREATAEALAYGWEHWDRVRLLENPAGYLYRVGRSKARRREKTPVVLMPAREVSNEPWCEPQLRAALEGLSERQRVAVSLLHGLEFTEAEVAALLGVKPGTVHKHAERGMRKIRAALGVIVDG